MRILILGGGGFLGRRLAEELIKNGGLAQGELVHLTLLDIAFAEDGTQDSRLEYSRQISAMKRPLQISCNSSPM